MAGRAELVEQACCRLTAPGIGSEGGSGFDLHRLLFQGLFLAPQMVAEALINADLVAAVFQELGYATNPGPGAERSDIIQAVRLGDPELLKAICRAFQAASPVGAYLDPVPAPMPGYASELVMAGGTFIDGSTSEFSADAPLREPYVLYARAAPTTPMGRSPWSGPWLRCGPPPCCRPDAARGGSLLQTGGNAHPAGHGTPVPDDCRFADSHEYVRPEGQGLRLGLSAFAIDQLGDIVFVDLPEVGATIQRGGSFGTVESVKAVEELMAPVSGVVEARNEAVLASPEELQNDPYGEGWLLVLRPTEPGELEDLLDAPSYRARVEGA